MGQFDNKTIVITGATAGLGRSLVKAFATSNCQIAGLGRRTEALNSLAEELQNTPAKFLGVTCDVSDRNSCETAFEKIYAEFKTVDILINNAGITNISLFKPKSHVEITEKLIQTNFMGAVYCASLAFDSVVTNKGSIVNISSVAGYSPLIGRTAYSASKHAMHGFFNTLGEEMKLKGAHVMTVCPTFIQTEIRSGNEEKVQGETLTPEYTADRVLKGIQQRKQLLLVGKTAIFAHLMYKLFPRWYERIMVKNQLSKLPTD